MLWTLLSVGLGGALGSMARHGMNVLIARRISHGLPAATAVVNVLGCLIVGLLIGALLAGRMTLSPARRTFVFVGLLGGFTTFSSFGLDTFTLLQEGRIGTAAANILVQVGGGLLGIYAGRWLAQ